jgi:hypothetical protein
LGWSERQTNIFTNQLQLSKTMGQVKSKTSVNVQIYNEGIFPGDMLTGKVCVDVPLREEVDDEAMELRLLGWEQTDSKVSHLGGLSRHMVSEIKHFLDVSYGILAFQPGKSLSTGKYEFPFQIPLHPGLKPNIVSRDLSNTGGVCQIGYRIEVRVRGPKTGGVLVRVFSKGLKITGAPLVQFPLFSTPIMAPLIPVKAVLVEGGWISFSANLSPGAVQIGQDFKVAYAIHNYSAATVNTLEICVYENIDWKGRKSSRCIYRNMLRGNSIGSGAPTRRQEMHSIYVHNGEIADERFLQQIKTELDTCSSSVAIRITPKTAREDFKNVDISVTHAVVLIMRASKGVRSEINIPLLIYADKVSVEKKITPSSPRGWYPTFIGPEAIYSLPGYNPPLAYPGMRPLVDRVDATFPKPFEWKAQDTFATFLAQITPSPVYSYGYEFRKWLDATATSGNVDTITPEEIHSFLTLTKVKPVDQLEVIDLYLARRSSFRCDQIYHMILACIPTYRLHIIQAVAPKCIDRENREVLQSVLSRFDYFYVQQYLGQSIVPMMVTRSNVYEQTQ